MTDRYAEHVIDRSAVEVEVLDQKPSEFRKGIYYTRVCYHGIEAKVVCKRVYAKGSKIFVRNVGAISDGVRLEQVNIR